MTRMINFMKNKIFILLGLCFVALVLSNPSNKEGNMKILDSMEMEGKPTKHIFKTFHSLFERTYPLNSEEGLKRYKIFKINNEWAKNQNLKLGKIVHRITEFMDLTHAEFKEKMLMKPRAMKDYIKSLKNKRNFPQKIYPEDEYDQSNFLQQADVTHMNWESGIKSQGGCGSCWAFAAIGAIENQYHKLTGALTLFSEQYLVDCDNLDDACGGGWPSETFEWIRNNGIISQEASPYNGIKQTCNTNFKQYEYKIVSGAEQVSNNFLALLAKGPLVVAMDASFEGLQSYRPVNFDPINPVSCFVNDFVDHAVTVVGSVTENNVRYLIARNSWGTNFGYKGYLKIPFAKSCGMTTYAWLPTVYNGALPKVVPPPVVKNTNCVTLSNNGFNDKIVETCDGLTDQAFNGIKFLPEQEGGNFIVNVFLEFKCDGGYYPLNYSYQNLAEYNVFPKSISMNKQIISGCVQFYLKECNAGDAEIKMCSDVTDTQMYNYTQLKDMKSLIVDSQTISSIELYSGPTYSGTKQTISFNATYPRLFNLGLSSRSKLANVRSIKIIKR